MDSSFFEYLQKLELLAFFSGYPLVYTILFFIAGNKKSKNNFTRRMVLNLPFAYALVGTLYIGLQLKNLYPDYSIQNIKAAMYRPWLIMWALLSVFFWIPAFAKRKILSLLHSAVFFFILLFDLLMQLSSSSIVKNDMNVYTVSLLLNIGSILLIVILSYLSPRNKNHSPS